MRTCFPNTSIHPSIHVYIICTHIYPSTYLSICTHKSSNLSIYTSIYTLTNLCVYKSICTSIYTLANLCVCTHMSMHMHNKCRGGEREPCTWNPPRTGDCIQISAGGNLSLSLSLSPSLSRARARALSLSVSHCLSYMHTWCHTSATFVIVSHTYTHSLC